MLTEGGDEVWCAVPEEVVFYHLSRRHATIDVVADSADEQRYRISFTDLPAGVACKELTFEAEVPAAWCNFPRIWIDGVAQPAELVRPRVLRATVDVGGGVEVGFRAGITLKTEIWQRPSLRRGSRSVEAASWYSGIPGRRPR